MEITWTNPAKRDLKKIFQYYKNKVSKNVADKIINSVFNTTAILKTQNIGVKEDLLEHLNQDHRYLVDGNYKIIYFVDNENSYITHVFDTRQNPVKLK
jgi:plasmid stabilization system protein ParE